MLLSIYLYQNHHKILLILYKTIINLILRSPTFRKSNNLFVVFELQVYYKFNRIS